MGVNTRFVPMAADAWTLLAEANPNRKALLIQSLGGVLILGINTNAPTIANEYGVFPAGLWSSIDTGAGPATFRLDAHGDDELAQQAWYGWLSPPTPGGDLTEDWYSSATWTVPAGVSEITVNVSGASGAGASGDAATGYSGGGGGGGAYASSVLAVTPGKVVTITVPAVNPVDDGGSNAVVWASLTGVKPTSVANGVLADSGGNALFGAPYSGGVAGLATNSIGQTVYDGGAGGAPAGGTGGAALNGTIAGPGVNNGSSGGGGAYAPTTPVAGAGAPGSVGLVQIVYAIPDLPLYVVVLESFDVVIPPKPEQYIAVEPPRLSQEALAYLRDLQAKISAQTPVPAPEEPGEASAEPNV